MRRTLLIAFVSAIGTSAFANLIVNGDFELNTSGGGFADLSDNWSNFTEVFAGSSPDTWDNNGVNGNAPGTSGYMPHVAALDGTKWIGIADDAGIGGFSEGVESTAFALQATTVYTLSVGLLYDEHNAFDRINPGPITVRLRQGANASTIVGVLGPNTVADQWQTFVLPISVGTTDSYSLILSNEGV